jgi:flagellar biogenesis protein FliO
MITLIILLILFATYLLGKYALQEGRRIHQQQELIKNMNAHDQKRKKEEFLADMDAQDPKWGKHKI